MTPHPLFSFTVPSLQGGTPIDCRLYALRLPVLFTSPHSSGVARLATIAHPYAPLGGSQNDTAVLLMVEELTKKGFITLTFDFRGSGLSKGKTSWTGRGEREDYESVIGVGICMLVEIFKLFGDITAEASFTATIGLEPAITKQLKGSVTGPSHVTPPISQPEGFEQSIILILAGYSYGSLIASLTCPLSDICERLAQPSAGSLASEMRLWARHLAQKVYDLILFECRQLQARSSVRSQSNNRSQYSSDMIFGGEESLNARLSGEIDRGRRIETIRKSVEKSASRFHLPSRGHQRDLDCCVADDGIAKANVTSPSLIVFPKISPCFLLLSPILPPLSSLLTCFSHHHFSASAAQQKENLRSHPTLAIFGTDDGFTSHRRLQKWTREFQEVSLGGNFRGVGIEGAGHLWREEGVDMKLRENIGGWAEELG